MRVLLVLSSLVLLTACTSPAPARPSSDAALVTWMGKFCTASETLLNMPAPHPDPGPTTEADRAPLLQFLTAAGSVLTSAKQAFAKMPAGPVKSANDLLDMYRRNIDSVLGDDAKYTAEARIFPPDGLESLYVVAGVDIGLFDPAGYPAAGYGTLDKYLAARPDLNSAYHRAPACQAKG
jgi:hypothetical protein